jgi:uncharacterized protein (DUF2225 family)
MRRLLLVLACVPVAYGTTTEEVAVKCPVCDNEFKAEQWNSTNNLGGVDRDFLKHAAGGQVFLIMCWTCPRCCYTGYPDDFDSEEAPKELIAKLKKENPLRPAEPIDPNVVESRKIPSWIRYDLRIQVLKLVPDTTAADLANTCLRTAQTQRFEWDLSEAFDKRYGTLYKKAWDALPEEKKVGRTNPYNTYMAIARNFEAEAADPKSDLEGAARLDARVSAALVYKERGEDSEAQRVLDSLAATVLPADLKTVAGEIRVRIERERKYQLLAIPCFEKHLAEGKPEAEEAISIKYLLGVLYRRTGDPKKAIGFLEPLLAEEGLPEGFKEWIRDEIAKAKAG